MLRRLAATLAVLSLSASTLASEARPRPIVISDARLAALVSDGYRRSETLRHLVHQVEMSGWTVFVLSGPCPIKEAIGCLLHTVGTFEGRPYLRIKTQMERHHPDVVLSLVGHELQHAVEVATSGEVHDAQTMGALFRRIGSMNASTAGGRLFETSAARRVGEQVLNDLRRVPSSVARETVVRAASEGLRSFGLASPTAPQR